MLADKLRALARTRGFVDLAYVDNQAGNSYSITVPSKARPGDFLLFFVASSSASATFTASGITSLVNASGRFHGYISAWNGTPSYTITSSGNTYAAMGVVVFRDVGFDVASALSAGGNPAVAASVTATTGNSILVFIGSRSDAMTWTALPSGFTTLLEDEDGAGASNYVGMNTGVAAGSTGTNQITGSLQCRAWQLVLKPI